ncbi:MAG: NADH-quinone oxidoreductase subunit C [Bacteroidales bacterium]|nr:NADH-quinone oxidoreductase subunit C [Bacteroidales bacterium]
MSEVFFRTKDLSTINIMNEQDILNKILDHFGNKVTGNVKREKRVELFATTNTIEDVLLYAKHQLSFIHFTQLSCVDWIEEKQFELVYIIWSPESKVTILIKVRVDRENPVAPNIDYIWRHANTFERELREMYGVQFEGLVGAQDFILEDWIEIPPMRRDFDTAEYAKKTFFDRPGRENARDVRETIRQNSGEEIPEFAKKYSR